MDETDTTIQDAQQVIAELKTENDRRTKILEMESELAQSRLQSGKSMGGKPSDAPAMSHDEIVKARVNKYLEGTGMHI